MTLEDRMAQSVLARRRRDADALTGADKAYLGVSISLDLPQSHIVEAGLGWLSDQVPQVGILIGDSLFAKTLVIQQGAQFGEAMKRAEYQAVQLISALHSVRMGHCEVLRSGAILSSVSARRATKRLKDAANNVPPLGAAIRDAAVRFCERQARNGRLVMRMQDAVEMSRDYLLEELAVYEVLALEGWLVEAYFGQEMPVLQSFMDGAFPGISPALEKRKFVELKVDKSSKRQSAC